ncbi:zinc ABC transporter permease AztB [Nocardia sp. XZ_19_385]|uniref:zinc ABC transporter permease AztB n=1 Tax=Nocardia sp. XZ_19_385 TaxID=2769488 RepID=UPI00188E4856|nr:zinc ABC transporter permease AztB [Nocardia sp. XZ_19_385]
MEWLMDPFEVAFVQRALWGGLLVSGICAVAGTWVVVRGMAFLGDAMAHGMLPGVAVAALLGGNLLLGAAISCGAMAFGVSVLSRNRRFSPDTGIGLLFVGMLALGVIIVSRSDSFAVDLTAFLFGDVLGVRTSDLGFLVAALVPAIAVAVLGHRAFVALAFDPRKAHTLGLRPKVAQVALVGLVTLAIVASFHVVGTLLVFGLLIAPPAAATFWADRIPLIMVLAAVFGAVSTFAGLLISWHAQTAAGATIAIVAVGLFFVSAIVSALRERLRRAGVGAAVLAAVVAVPLAGCGAEEAPSAPTETPHGYVEGAEETADAQSRLILADQATGAIRVLDLITEKVTEAGKAEGAQRLVGDGRYGYAGVRDAVRITDGGAWMVDHDDHVHYYRAPIRAAGSVAGGPITAVHSDKSVVAVAFENGATVLLDRAELDKGTVKELHRIGDGVAVPYAENLVVAGPAGRVEIRSRAGAPVTTVTEPCQNPRGQAVTRRGVVFGCADGALVVRKQEDGFTGEKIPYPQPVPEADRAVEFTHRPSSTALTAKAGRQGLWSLDIRKKTWKLVPLADVVAVNTAGEGAPLLALTRDGMLHGFDPETGERTTQTKVLVTPADTASLVVDTARAYINDAPARVVHEIDYNDNLRVARTFTLDIAPTLMVETGQ